ncbi:hypothetical protein [Dyella sp. EPa41]|uniref:hypothetical protein n=1 Tax=Dyella sp. EPa41 TaxID=1561194 RepID=UPI0019150DFB|nr:hypothetical protein [Dyella sp. EPa41]
MFEDAKPQIENIVALVALCPDKLQEKCFELLLTSYLQSLSPSRPAANPASVTPAPALAPHEAPSNAGASATIPDAIKTRFNSLVSRTKVNGAKAADLFDFNVDPFTFHALSVPGSSTTEKMRNVALLLALKGYLISASWVADWKEFRATCIDHSCWDQGNVAKTMKHKWFKVASSATDISLTGEGIKAAEGCFTKLASGPDDASA